MKKLTLLLLLLYISPIIHAQAAKKANPFITTWVIEEAQDTLNIIGSADYTYDFQINWGDGTTETITTNEFSHVYADTGSYDIQIMGIFPHMTIAPEDAAKIIDVSNWGNIVWQDMTSMFNNATKLRISATDTPNLSQVTSLESMFQFAVIMNDDIGHWDVSNITNMKNTFYLAQNFNQDISEWDVSNVTNFQGIFGNALRFDQDLNDWDVSSATTMRQMFFAARAFNSDISDWDVSNVTNFQSMFDGAYKFNQDISDWDVSSSTTMALMFQKAYDFDQDLSKWDVSNVQTFQSMFSHATSFNQDISNWDVTGAYSMANIFRNATSFDQNLGKWDVSNISSIFDVLTGTHISTENYDSLLIGWSQLPKLFQNANFNGGSATYSPVGEVARQKIIDDFGWTFTDGGLAETDEDSVTFGKVVEYTFDDGTANDAIGDNHGVISGATSAEDRFGNAGKAMSFDGVDDYITFGDSSEFRFGENNFSLSFWLKFDENQKSFVLGKRKDSGSNSFDTQYSFHIINGYNYSSAGSSLNFHAQDDNNGSVLSRFDNLKGDWHHVTFVQKADTNTTVYIDGDIAYTINIASFGIGSLSVDGEPFVMGYRHQTNDYFYKGLIDDVTIYNYAIDGNEVALLYDNYHENYATSNEDVYEAPHSYALQQNYPNPFNPATTISYSLPQSSMVSVVVYNLMGQKVATLVNEVKTAGEHSINFDASDLSSGVYIYQIKAGTFTQSKKLTLIK